MLILSDEADGVARYADAAEFFRQRHCSAKNPNDVGNEDLKKSSVVVLGYDNAVLKRLIGGMEQPPPDLSVQVKRNLLNQANVFGAVNARALRRSRDR